MLTSDVQGLIDVLHEAETFGTWVLIIKAARLKFARSQIAFPANGTTKILQ